MLQIASGMYFTTEDLHRTVHRRVAYTNATRLRGDDIQLPIGMLRFTSSLAEIAPLIVEVVELEEKVDANGNPGILVATSGDELVDDVIAVVSFGLNVFMSPDPDLTRRLVGVKEGRRKRAEAANRLRRTFDGQLLLSDGEVASLTELCHQLLELRRPAFEAAIRAIRRVVDAVRLVGDDVTLAYTLFVAALESLAADTTVVPATWEQYDRRKRDIVEEACDGLPPERVKKIQQAVLDVDQLSLRRKFISFVLSHITTDFYRDNAADAVAPVRAVDLPRALDFAYVARSRSLHELRDLAPELWLASDREDTTWHAGQTVLTVEGLHRLCRHVIVEYIRRAPRGVDATFQQTYREHLPGQMKVRLAPQYWVGSWTSFEPDDAPQLFNALAEMLLAARRGEKESVAVMSAPLERIERILPGQAKQSVRVPLVATYALWHEVAPQEFHRPNAERLIRRYASDLNEPNVVAYATAILLDRRPTWTAAQVEALLDEREAVLRRSKRVAQELPTRLEAALRLDLAQRLHEEGLDAEARVQIGKAIELVPGDPHLLRMERGDLAELERMHVLGFAAGIERVDGSSPDVGGAADGPEPPASEKFPS